MKLYVNRQRLWPSLMRLACGGVVPEDSVCCSRMGPGSVTRSARHSMCILALLALCGLHSDRAGAQERERCYPGPPLHILKELLGGNFTPERYRYAILDYARRKCSNGQTLKLVSPAGPGKQDQLNEQVALELCD